MVTSLGPWDSDWKTFHRFVDGIPNRSCSRYGCTEPPYLIQQEIMFLEKNFPRSPRILLLSILYDHYKHETKIDKEEERNLKYYEWQVWWHEEQEFIELNRLGKALKSPPSFDELQERYSGYLAKSTKYIPHEMYMDWIHSKVLPNIRFCESLMFTQLLVLEDQLVWYCRSFLDMAWVASWGVL